MASRIETVLGLVETRLDAQMAATYPSGVAYAFGETERHRNTRWPHVSFVPTSIDILPQRGRAGGFPRPLAGLTQTVRAVVWGEDHEKTEELVFQLLRALYLEAGTSNISLDVNGGEWRLSRNAHDGWAAELTFAVTFTVQDAQPTATATDVGHTTGIEGSVQNGCQA